MVTLTELPQPTADQLRMARAVLGPLTNTQRQAVYAVIVNEAAQELRKMANTGGRRDG